MSILTTNNNNNKRKQKIVYFFYLLESYDVWHDKLVHVNYNINIKVKKS